MATETGTQRIDGVRSTAAATKDERASTLLLGFPIDDVTMDETIDRIFDLVADGRSSGRTHQVTTVNVDFIVNALGDAELADVMRTSSLSIPDGMPIVWGSRLLGSPIRTRVAGADLLGGLARRAVAENRSILLLGAGPGIAQRTADALRRLVPGAVIHADEGPSFRSIDDLTPADVAHLADYDADICCVAFGNPKQELFISRFGPEHLKTPVMIGVGGTLDFFVDAKKRAPEWMQRSGLEWVHRAATEPRRLAKRYAIDAARFVPGLARQWFRGRAGVRDGTVVVERRAPAADDQPTLDIDFTDLGCADNRVASDVVSAIRSAPAGTRVNVVGHQRTDLDRVAGFADYLRRIDQR